MAENKDFTSSRKKVTLVDLFAGAGGISEGFCRPIQKINTSTSYSHRILIQTAS